MSALKLVKVAIAELVFIHWAFMCPPLLVKTNDQTAALGPKQFYNGAVAC